MIITSAQAQLLGVRPGTLRLWVHRGHVRRLGRDSYDLTDVLARVCRKVADTVERV